MKIHPVFFVLLSSLMSSCNFGVYVPAYQNVPLFQKKGEIQIQAGQSNAQAAVAVGNHWGILANAQRVDRNSQSRGFPLHTWNQHQRMELGVGYFSTLKTNETKAYELYGGIGHGYAKYYEESNRFSPQSFHDYSWNSVNTSFFLQPSIGRRRKKSSISFSTKINWVTYGAFLGDSTFTPYFFQPVDVNQPITPSSRSNLLFVEPALTTSLGGKHFRWTMQIVYTFSLLNQGSFRRRDVYYPEVPIFRFGLSYRWNTSKKGKVQQGK